MQKYSKNQFWKICYTVNYKVKRATFHLDCDSLVVFNIYGYLAGSLASTSDTSISFSLKYLSLAITAITFMYDCNGFPVL